MRRPNAKSRMRCEKLTKAMCQEKCIGQKLTDIFSGWITQVQFKADSEVEESVEVEESEVVGMEDIRMTGGTQLSAMEVNKEEEDEVIVVEEVK